MESKEFIEIEEGMWCFDPGARQTFLHGYRSKNHSMQIAISIDAYIQRKSDTEYEWKLVDTNISGVELTLDLAKSKIEEFLKEEEKKCPLR